MFLSRNSAVVCLWMLLAFGWPYCALAEEEASSAESVAEAEIAPEGEIGSEASSSASEVIHPLDHWVEISSVEASSEMESESQGPTEISDEDPEIPVYAPTPKPHYPVVGAEHAILKKPQKARIDKIDKKLRSIVYKEEQARIAESKKDPRGESEIRICSVNFNSIGTKEENARLLKKIPKPRLANAEKSVIQAIVTADCDVVAVQGIIGRSPSFAMEALSGIVKKLVKKSGKIPWKAEVAKSKEQNGYQAFLIKDASDSPIAGFQVETITDSIMKVPGRRLKTVPNLKNEIVPRDFLKLKMEVKSSDLVKKDPLSLELKTAAKENREVVIINGILAKGVAPFQADDRLLKLQIADVAVRLFVAEQSRVTPNEQPIVLAAIERVEGILGGAQHILTGRLNIDDFEKDGICKILQGDLPPPPKEEGEEGAEDDVEEEVKIEEKTKPGKVIDFTIDTDLECRVPLDRPQPRFDILASVPFEKKAKPAEEPSKKAPKISKRDLELQTAGIFVVSADLKYSAKKGTNLLDSAAGRVQISNGLPGAYLVWVDLNW